MADVDELRSRVVQLEELFSHHQHHVQQLNEVIVDLRGELDALHMKLTHQQRLVETLRENQTDAAPIDPADEKPPHY